VELKGGEGEGEGSVIGTRKEGAKQ